jgi:hypothetical protein
MYAPEDARFARQLRADLRQRGVEVRDLTQESADLAAPAAQRGLIVVLSPQTVENAALTNAMNTALDSGAHIVPVLTTALELPKLIDHIHPFDFSAGATVDQVQARLAEIATGEAGRALRVLTPTVRKSNRQTGLLLAVLVLGMFGVGLYGVGVLGIQAPRREFDAVETERALTREFFVIPELEQYALLLPRSTEAAANYEATVRTVPTVYRSFVAGTATAFAQGTPLPPTLTPSAEPSPSE